MTLNGDPPHQMQSSAAGAKIAAEATRLRRSLHRALDGLTVEEKSARARTEAPFAPGIFGHGGGEMRIAEIGPQHVEERQFGIRRLP